jgi:hypothetical protein
MERLTEREPYWLGEEFWTSAKEPDDEEIDNVYAKLKEYEDLEEQGLLIRLHCKRHDTVYFIKSAFSMACFPIEAKIYSIRGLDCDNDVMYDTITKYNGISRMFRSSDIGKTVFLTKEEAERALEERK